MSESALLSEVLRRMADDLDKGKSDGAPKDNETKNEAERIMREVGLKARKRGTDGRFSGEDAEESPDAEPAEPAEGADGGEAGPAN